MSATRTQVGQRYVSTTTIAQRVGFHPDYLRRLRRLGGGPPYVRVGRAVRYDIQAFDRWMEGRTYASEADELARGVTS